jgi:hypothetical protein
MILLPNCNAINLLKRDMKNPYQGFHYYDSLVAFPIFLAMEGYSLSGHALGKY